MSFDLVYTSSPRGLKPGSIGFCTVAASQGLPQPLADRLESISGYRPLFPLGHARAGQNPVNWCYYRVPAAGRTWSVLSRIAFAGSDYTGRSNKIASHLALEPSELPPAGPAALLRSPGLLSERFDGEPRLLPPRILPGELPAASGPCRGWQQLTGDAGWAGVLAEQFVLDPSRPYHLLLPQGVDPLPLVDEVLGLLSPEQRWMVTFSTYFTDPPAGLTCSLRVLVEGSPIAEQVRRAGAASLLDLTRPLGDLTEGRYVSYARTGRPQDVAATPAGRKLHLNRPAPEPSPTRAPRTSTATADVPEPAAAIEWVVPSPLRANAAEPKVTSSLPSRWLGLAAAAVLVSFAAGTWLGYSLRPRIPAAAMASAATPAATASPAGIASVQPVQPKPTDPAASTQPADTEPPSETAREEPVQPNQSPAPASATQPQPQPPQEADASDQGRDDGGSRDSSQSKSSPSESSQPTQGAGQASPPSSPPTTTPADNPTASGQAAVDTPSLPAAERPPRPTAEQLQEWGLMHEPPIVVQWTPPAAPPVSGSVLRAERPKPTPPTTQISQELPGGFGSSGALYWAVHPTTPKQDGVTLNEGSDGLHAKQGDCSVRMQLRDGQLVVTWSEGASAAKAESVVKELAAVVVDRTSQQARRIQFNGVDRKSEVLTSGRKISWPWNEDDKRSLPDGVISITHVGDGVSAHFVQENRQCSFTPARGSDASAGVSGKEGASFTVQLEPLSASPGNWVIVSTYTKTCETVQREVQQAQKSASEKAAQIKALSEGQGDAEADQLKKALAGLKAEASRWVDWQTSLDGIQLVVIERQNAYGKVLFRGEFLGPKHPDYESVKKGMK